MDLTKTEAERLWELAIEAKGGRKKLRAIQNIQISSVGSFHPGAKKIRNRNEFLIVYPNKYWEWDDNRPSNFGLRMKMYDLALGRKYVAGEGSTRADLVPFEKTESAPRQTTALIWVTLENSWHRPTPTHFTSIKIGSKEVDNIQTCLNGQRIDFALDRQTHLPIKVSFFLNDLDGNNEHLSYEVHLSDYVDQDGIMVPKTVSEDKFSYHFNVNYNEDIFKMAPLPVESAAEAWKPKKKL